MAQIKQTLTVLNKIWIFLNMYFSICCIPLGELLETLSHYFLKSSPVKCVPLGKESILIWPFSKSHFSIRYILLEYFISYINYFKTL